MPRKAGCRRSTRIPTSTWPTTPPTEGICAWRLPTPNSFTFKEGTLIVDAWDAERQELVWRGMATAALSSNPDKNDKKIEKALRKIMKRWDEAKGYRVRAIREMKLEEDQN
jgi:hypothetical protein